MTADGKKQWLRPMDMLLGSVWWPSLRDGNPRKHMLEGQLLTDEEYWAHPRHKATWWVPMDCTL